ncbi:uroporphyrinogen decarboxylase [Flavilitoribacter nigricans]|uniref:Uroporphyrinogen decarboxylase n=1 Tax=Flavilitoribacter nigricans (strain ATCC 23147 / DSM 23189 / NBRC 102662 / NCIMB 1420 / SS-2) TaxID=1122177 RepID=A0A2D0N305_FLAN2|nr:uroporphyrinogen decarboxylase [Flavilitoribacter nigricans]PHN02875.1 uroporphyrinogen decarboxylase [Flavilitoribacter nigricans DSM 23189 = NBRC 102662]
MKLKNDLLLRTVRGEQVERPPVWLMRQAGRVLPQYRALRGKLSGFKELVETPELAAEVTIQPIDEWGVDAAIIFSDILVIPEAMGLEYQMVEKRGPLFPKTIQNRADIEGLRSGDDAAAHLEYVYHALDATVKGLDGRVPLIGFAGAPWTILAYMVEGSGSKTFSKAKKFLYTEPELAHLLLDKITRATISYLQTKAEHGVSLIQLFDSWAGILSPEQYRTFAVPYLRRISQAISTVPVTVFAKNAWFALEDLGQIDCEVIGLDWNTHPSFARPLVGDKVLQGNMDPCQLYASHDSIIASTREMIRAFGGRQIVNLGHGLYPDIEVEKVRTFVDTVKNFRY